MRRRSFLTGSAAASALPPAALAEAGLPVAGLQAPLEIVDDRWGVPHVRARTFADAFFGQGFVTARDRLWQIDLKRRRGLGRLAEVMGEAFLPFDHAARLFLYRGDLNAEWRVYGPRVETAARAYVAGVNAYVGLMHDSPEQLPVEFRTLGYLPDRWNADDLIRLRASPAGNVEAEVRRARLACLDALRLDRLAQPLEPAWSPTVPQGLDVCNVGPDDLKLFRLLTAPLPWSPRADSSDPGAAAEGGARDEGSNAWIVSPRLSATGRPILANDPHLAIGIPSVRHLVHFSGPGVDVIGGSDPGTPGVAQGHNGRIAFGRTNFHIDQEDLYVLQTRAGDPDRYRGVGGWRTLHTVVEEIAVKGRAPEQVTLKFSELGPVIAEQPERGRAVALQAVWMRPGATRTLSDIAVNLARDWPSFRQALRLRTFPTNYHYADVAGNIGWHAAGHAPVRPSHDGLMPVPGDGRYPWAGVRALEELPSELNPSRGWIATANQMNLPPGYPQAERKISFEWTAPFRYQRIAEVLGAARKISLSDCVELQHDTVSIPARRLLALLRQSPASSADDALLLSWDGRVEAASGAAALFEIWWWELGRALRDAALPELVRPLIPNIDPVARLELLENPGAWLGPNGPRGRDELMRLALNRAVATLEKKLGPERASWSWGRLHTVNLAHPLMWRLDPARQADARVGGGSSGGDAYTVMARWWSTPERTNVTGGASCSMVLDVGGWDDSLALNLPGQTAEPGSRHYGDLYRAWLQPKPFPLLYSRKAIDGAVARRTRLRPR